MKTNLLFLSIILLVGLVSCNEDSPETSGIGFEPANELYFPKDEYIYNCNIEKEYPLKFEWAFSKQSDYINITYELLIDSLSGDFSKPIYTIKSDNNGISSTVSLDNSVIDMIAERAKADRGEMAEVKWTVRATRDKFSVLYDGETCVRLLFINRTE